MEKKQFVQIKSPVIGTFTQSGTWPCGSEVEPLVKVGDRVEPHTVVCGVSALAIDIPVKADARGKIIERTVQHGDAVGYGEMLFIVDPDG